MENLRFFERLIAPEGLGDLVYAWVGISLALVSACLTFNLIKRTKISVAQTVLVITALMLLWVVAVYSIIPGIRSFPKGKVGVLVMNMKDSGVRGFIGGEHFNSALCVALSAKLEEFEASMGLSSLDTLVDFKSVSWVADSKEEAVKFKRKYGASVVVWGQFEYLTDSVNWTGHTLNDIVSFRLDIPGTNGYDFAFEQESGGNSMKLRFGQSPPALGIVAWNVINNLLPSMVTHSSRSDPLLAAQIIQRMPTADSYYQDSCDYMGFLWLVAGDIFANKNEIIDAGICYDSSYNSLKRLQESHRGDRMARYIPPIVVRKAITLSKFREGLLALRLGVWPRARDYFTMARREADDSLWAILSRELRQRGVDSGLYTN